MRWDWWFKAAFAALVLFAPAEAVAGSVFDGSVASAHDFSMFPFWQKVLSDAAPAAPQPLLIPAAYTGPQPAAPCTNERTCAPPEWLAFLDTLRGQAPLAQIDAVNRWANAKPYVDDFVNWHVPDYWETPGEFIAHGGDCEDYAIAKYFSLIRLGFAPDSLRLVVVDDSVAHVFHAVLAVQLDGKVWLLDNQRPDLTEMSDATQYTPVYSLNQNGWWLHSNPTIRLAGLTMTVAPSAGK
jgi:predicted transglutaminase-like cysteine proteinase